MLKAVACTVFFALQALPCLAQDDDLPLVTTGGSVLSEGTGGPSLDISTSATELEPGDTSRVEIVVRGLNGLEAPLFLNLVNNAPDVVTLEGGDVQVRDILPGDIGPDGTFIATALVSAKEAGRFDITARLLDRKPQQALAIPAAHAPNISDPPHEASVTYAPTHFWRATWAPHLAKISWPHHTTGDTFATPHTASVTFGPKGIEHKLETTWPHIERVTKWQHYAGVTYGMIHHHRVTWPDHVAGVTWGPGRHDAGTTYREHVALISWPHIRGGSWRPHATGDSWGPIAPAHVEETTWPGHVPELTWPPGHVAAGTWPPHSPRTSWPSEHQVQVSFPPHVALLTFPKGTSHAAGTTWPGTAEHQAGQTWPPHFAKVTWAPYHGAGVTWPDQHGRDSWPPRDSHVAGQTWPPHARSVTWPPHVAGGTWSPHSLGTTFTPHHNAGVSWPVHQQPMTWPPVVAP